MIRPIFKSKYIYNLGLLQNVKTHIFEEIIKTIETYILQKIQILYFIIKISFRIYISKYILII